MKIDWGPLRREFKLWRAQNLSLPVWWRDDDALDATAALDQLVAVAEEVQVPVHLAVVPRNSTRDLAARIKGLQIIVPVVHGWVHRNNAPPGHSRNEFSDHRGAERNCEEAAAGLLRLQRLFPTQAAPMFVPPWNHLGPEFKKHLPNLGYQVLSTCNPRRQAVTAYGLRQVNTHFDPIAWRENEDLVAPDELIDKIVMLLRQRRESLDDNTEPFGILTHHLAMNDNVWSFTRQYWQEILNGPCRIVEIVKER